MRLIDADKLKKHYAWWGSEGARDELKERKKDFDDIIDLQPTVEAEPIRRCKDCKNYKLFTEVYVGKAYCEEYGGFITENDYCSRGAKMDGKENEND